ncbi:MAG: hypothetical protein A4S09_04200 [Proteobacteria bacterium SG_bin7]|nr:MAG: hypothetical protein A4S09_04200 [Proteobacteria bacterium SG_bin7]
MSAVPANSSGSGSANLAEQIKPLAKLEEDLIREANRADRVGTLTHRIMMLVAYKSYGQAISELKEYVAARSKEMSALYLGSHRYILRIETLTKAIEKKRSMPHLEKQSAAKQQEIFDLVKEYFGELRGQLKGIETVERSLMVEDVRSTVWTVRAVAYSMIAILVAGFLVDISTGTYNTIVNVIKDFIIFTCDWILSFFF